MFYGVFDDEKFYDILIGIFFFLLNFIIIFFLNLKEILNYEYMWDNFY